MPIPLLSVQSRLWHILRSLGRCCKWSLAAACHRTLALRRRCCTSRRPHFRRTPSYLVEVVLLRSALPVSFPQPLALAHLTSLFPAVDRVLADAYLTGHISYRAPNFHQLWSGDHLCFVEPVLTYPSPLPTLRNSRIILTCRRISGKSGWPPAAEVVAVNPHSAQPGAATFVIANSSGIYVPTRKSETSHKNPHPSKVGLGGPPVQRPTSGRSEPYRSPRRTARPIR